MLQRQSTCLALNKYFPPANLGKDALHRLLPMLPNIQVAFDRLLPPILTKTWKIVFPFLIFLPSFQHITETKKWPRLCHEMQQLQIVWQIEALWGVLTVERDMGGVWRGVTVSGTLQCIMLHYISMRSGWRNPNDNERDHIVGQLTTN